MVTDIGDFTFGIDSTAGTTATGFADHGSFCTELVTVAVPRTLCPTTILSTGQPVFAAFGIVAAITFDAKRVDTQLSGQAFRILGTGSRQDDLARILVRGIATGAFNTAGSGIAFRIDKTWRPDLRRTSCKSEGPRDQPEI